MENKLQPGTKLREYTIIEELNCGAFGSIYRAFQPSVEREVAIKVILPRFANQPEFVQRMESEARLVARLEHPHIVPLYDYWRDESGAYLVMRWLRQGSLESRLQQGPMPIDDVLRLLDQVASALSETHQQGVVHRDLKPANIVLDEQGNAYLTDFGIAMDLDVDTKLAFDGAVVGSPAYMAPEQLLNEPVAAQTDIYSLGIMLFEMLTGRLPYRATSMPALIQQQLSESLPSAQLEREELPSAVDWILGRAAAKNASARYDDVLELARIMRQVLGPASAGVLLDQETAPQGTRTHRDVGDLLTPDREGLPVFAGREQQLEILGSFLDDALSGAGRIVCVTGGSGRGKTTLINEFAGRAMANSPDLLVISGSCNLYSAAGDPFLPFRQLMAMLTADVESQLRSGLISEDQAQRLVNALPVTVNAIIDRGPELLDVLVPSKALRERTRKSVSDWPGGARRLQQFFDSGSSSGGQKQRNRLFSQFTAVIHTICQIYPIILILDDLQWVDKSSAGLLYHLSRHLAGQRILVVCSYRPDEIAMQRDSERHPMDKVLAEIKSLFGSIWINLAKLGLEENREFVSSLLDQEPNRLSASFRQALFDHTAGHALFTVELLRAMQERGDLVRDSAGQWIESPSLNWETLPPRIEGVIEERVGRLDPELRSLLNTASVEGEHFTAQVIATVEGESVRRVLRLLARELGDVHQLIKEREELQVNQTYLTRYQFSHVLIQQYLYGQLGAGERRLLHEQIAQDLQKRLQDHWQPFAAQLAWHWQQAGRRDMAVEKWLWLGDQARGGYAHVEAENFYRLAVAELQRQGRQEAAARTLMKLGLVYTADFQAAKAQEVYDQAFDLWQRSYRARSTIKGDLAGVVLRLATEAPVSFDPGLIDDDVSTFLVSQLFEGLVRVGQEQNVLPAAASRWEMLDGGRRYIFHIRDNAQWNDGRPLTAHDFVFAWTRNLHQETHSPSAQLLYILEQARAYAEGKITDKKAVGVAALDNKTLAVQLERPTAYLPFLMAHTVAFPLPAHSMMDTTDKWANPQRLVCNGPYQIEKVDTNGLRLSKNQRYVGQFSGNVETVECIFLDEYESVLRAYAQNQLDMVNLIHADPDTIARAGSLFGDELMSIPRWSTFYLCFRCDKPPFDDARVRQALAYALNREQLAIEGFQSQRKAATGGFVPPGMPGHSPGIALAYDPEQGRRLLAQAGFENERDFPSVEWAASPGGERVISFIQAAWKQNLNLDIGPLGMNWESFMDKLSHDPAQLTILGWGADIPDPVNMLRATFHSRDGFNIPHWHNERFDALTDEAERVLDQEQRMRLYAQADRILVAEDTAVLPLSYALGRLLVKPWVRLPITSTISMSIRFATVVRPG